MTSLDGIAVFSKVVELEGFTAAARELRLSKAAVSKQVARLEDRLGVRLLHRTTRRLSPTAEGQAYYERCRRIMEEAEAAERAVTELHDAPRGMLRINAPMSFGNLHLAPMVAEFMSLHAELEVDLVLNDRRVDIIEEGFDMGIRIGRLADSSLIARKLAPSRRVVCASPQYWARHGRPNHPEELKHHECLSYSYLATPGEWTFRGPDGTHRVRVGGRLRSNGGESLLAATIAGQGVNAMPTFIGYQALADGRLEAVLQDWEPEDVDIHAMWPHNRHLSARVRLFVDFLAGRLGPNPYWDDWRTKGLS